MTELLQRIASALRGRVRGNNVMCSCPAHKDRTPSLLVTEAVGKLLVYCYAGCSQDAVIDALKRGGLWPENDHRVIGERANYKAEIRHNWDPTPLNQEDINRQVVAEKLWRESQPANETLVEDYLRFRKIIEPIPDCIRFGSTFHADVMGKLPTMVAALTDRDGALLAVQRTFLAKDGRGKADVGTKKLSNGPMSDGAVRLSDADGTWLGIAEGIETGLSAQQLYGLPVWVACGGHRMGRVWIPDHVCTVLIFADNGASGDQIAEKARRQFLERGIDVVVQKPPEQFKDFNDLLTGKTMEPEDVRGEADERGGEAERGELDREATQCDAGELDGGGDLEWPDAPAPGMDGGGHGADAHGHAPQW